MTTYAYSATGSITATIDGRFYDIPDDLSNYMRQVVAEWEAEGNSIEPYVAPAIEVVYPDLSARQFWLAASRIGVTKGQVVSLVEAMTDQEAAADLLIEVNESSTFSRSSLTISDLSGLLNIASNEIDDLWLWAAQL